METISFVAACRRLWSDDGRFGDNHTVQTRLLVSRENASDIDGMAALYEPQADF